MAYTKTEWLNNQTPAINESNLNKIEQGLADAHDHVDSAHAPADAEKNVNADWDSVSGDSEILHKPTILTLAGTNTQIQFNDNGLFGADGKFEWDKVNSALKIGDNPTILPNNPLAIQALVDGYIQTNLQNTDDGTESSADHVITADNGDNDTHYLDLGINSSTYNSLDYPIYGANDAYLYAPDDNLFLGACGAGKEVVFHTDGSETANIQARIDANGINLPSGKTYRINGIDITTTGMSNPMTAVGDIIIGGTAGAPTALPAGSAGKILRIASGSPTWDDETSYGDEAAQDAVGAMADSESLVYTDATPLLAVKVQQSITKDASGVKLSGDSTSPGNNKVYGTDAAGAKGWKDDPGSSAQIESFGITVDGGGSAVSTGSKGFREVPFNCTVNSWTILGKESGSCVVDVKRSTYAGFPATSSIAGTEKPTLSSAQKNQDLSLTTWTTSLVAGDILEFVVDSASTVTRIHVFLTITRT